MKGISGRAFGGQQPVSGAAIQLYAANTTTLKGASTPLISATVLTDNNGYFSISNDYACPSGSQVYITSSGGNSGGGTNNAIVLFAALGPCSSLNGSLSAFTSSGTGLTPIFGIGTLHAPIGVAVDMSGNVWTANSGDNTLTEFVGLASPVVTPLAARLQ